MQDAREQNRIKVYCLGVGLDALTLTATILTVAVFDELFGEAVQINAEGTLIAAADSGKVSDGLPFDQETVRRLLEDEPMASPGACILDRAWPFRSVVLA